MKINITENKDVIVSEAEQKLIIESAEKANKNLKAFFKAEKGAALKK